MLAQYVSVAGCSLLWITTLPIYLHNSVKLRISVEDIDDVQCIGKVS